MIAVAYWIEDAGADGIFVMRQARFGEPETAGGPYPDFENARMQRAELCRREASRTGGVSEYTVAPDWMTPTDDEAHRDAWVVLETVK